MDGVAPSEGATVAAAAITPCQPRGKEDGDPPPLAAASEPEPSNPEATVERTSKDESIGAAKAPSQIQSQMLKMPDVPRLPVAISPGATVAANDNHFVASISCPDGSKVELSSDCCLSEGTDCRNNQLSSMLLGRGKNGIPAFAVHVSQSACAIRIVKRKMGIHSSHRNGDDGGEGKEQTDKKPIYGLELVVVGSQPCRVTRMNTRRNADGGRDDDNNSTTITLQVPSPLTQNYFGHTTCPLLNGDIVEPYFPEDGVDCREFEKAGNYLPFVVGIAVTTKGPVDASSRPDMSAFVEASKRIMREGEEMACADDSKKASSKSQDTVSVMKENVADKADVKKNPISDSAGDDAANETKPKLIESHVAGTDEPMGEDKKESHELKLQPAAPAAHSAPEDRGTGEASERPCTKEKDAKEPASSVSKVVTAPPKQEASQEMSSSSEPEKSSEEDNDYIGNPREDVLEILEGVDSPGSFATGGSCGGGHLIMPGIEVDGVGIIGLPLSEAQAKSLAARCEQAPFGRGSETIVDKRVRNTFQLAPEHFKITNPRWAGEISNLLSRVCRDLGVQTHLKVEAQLYKLLLYEEGSFFAMHRDSEKVDGMFGTLVIVLPTKFTGGELVVKHQGQVKQFSQSQSSSFGSQYASFYADCKHELEPVTSGHRLCLVYNLVKTGAGACPRAQRNRQILKRLKRAVHAWANAFDGQKLVIMTEHLYTPAGISGGGRSGMGSGGGSAKFKGNDAAVVHLLEQAIEEGIDMDWDHGTISYSESGYGEGDCYYDRYHGGGDFSWGETTDSQLSLVLSSWGAASINTEEIVPEDYWEDKEPKDETFEPTGNEGVDAERQYADEDAIVVWPRSQRWIIVTDDDTDKMCSYLLKACTPGTSDSESKVECVAKARKVIEKIVSSRTLSSGSGYSYNSCDSQSNVLTMLKALTQLGDHATALDFLSKYIAADVNTTPDSVLKEVLPFMDRFGADAVRPYMLAAIDKKRCSADPSKTAQFVLKYRNLLQTRATYSNLATDIVVAFVDGISPTDNNDRRPHSKTLDSFPLKDVLQLFYGDCAVTNGGALARRVLDSVLFLSCQPVKEQPLNSWSNVRTIQSRGPTLLLKAGLVEMLGSLPRGWAEFGSILMDAVDKLCMHGSIDSAVALVEDLALHSPTNDIPERVQVCGRMATLLCDRMLSSCRTAYPGSYVNATNVLASYKRLFRIIAHYCPSQAQLFATTAKGLDVDSILIPFVTDSTIRNIATGHELKEALGTLTKHCASVISPRTSYVLGNVSAWTLPAHTPLPRNFQLSGFLKNPCQQVFDWQVRKSDHKGFFQDLATLISAGEVKAESYQPRGRGAYHFKITKLKRRTISIDSFANMTCSCANTSGRSNYGYGNRYGSSASSNSNCLVQKHKATVVKYKQDEKALSLLMQLLPLDLRNQEVTRKRQASAGAAAAAAAPGRSATAAAAGTSSAAKKQKPSSSGEVIDLT